MPSHRLFKVPDPTGCRPRASVLASHAPRTLVWSCSPRLRTWIVGELWAAGVQPLVATSLTHVSRSLRPNARPELRSAVIDLDSMEEAVTTALVALRWGGYTGAIIALRQTGSVADRIRVAIDTVVRPEGERLQEAIERFVLRSR